MSLRKEKSLRTNVGIVSEPFELLASIMRPRQYDKRGKSGKPSTESNHKPKRKQIRILIGLKDLNDMYMCLQLPPDQHIHKRHRKQAIIGLEVLDSHHQKDQFYY